MNIPNEDNLLILLDQEPTQRKFQTKLEKLNK